MQELHSKKLGQSVLKSHLQAFLRGKFPTFSLTAPTMMVPRVVTDLSKSGGGDFLTWLRVGSEILFKVTQKIEQLPSLQLHV